MHASDDEATVLRRIQELADPLESVMSISRGEEIGRKQLVHQGIPIIIGHDICRYRITPSTNFVSSASRNRSIYRSPKIVVVKTGQTCIASIDRHHTITLQSGYILHCKDGRFACEYILVFLNSRFTRFFIFKTFTAYKLLFPQLNQSTLMSIPIPDSHVAKHDRVVELVQSMLDMNAKLQGGTLTPTLSQRERESSAPTPDPSPTPGKGRGESVLSPQEVNVLKRRIESTDREIDQLVYELYRLTDDEIRIVEEALDG